MHKARWDGLRGVHSVSLSAAQSPHTLHSPSWPQRRRAGGAGRRRRGAWIGCIARFGRAGTVGEGLRRWRGRSMSRRLLECPPPWARPRGVSAWRVLSLTVVGLQHRPLSRQASHVVRGTRARSRAAHTGACNPTWLVVRVWRKVLCAVKLLPARAGIFECVVSISCEGVCVHQYSRRGESTNSIDGDPRPGRLAFVCAWGRPSDSNACLLQDVVP